MTSHKEVRKRPSLNNNPTFSERQFTLPDFSILSQKVQQRSIFLRHNEASSQVKEYEFCKKLHQSYQFVKLIYINRLSLSGHRFMMVTYDDKPKTLLMCIQRAFLLENHPKSILKLPFSFFLTFSFYHLSKLYLALGSYRSIKMEMFLTNVN